MTVETFNSIVDPVIKPGFTITIKGTPSVGNRLSTTISAINGAVLTGTKTYQWYKRYSYINDNLIKKKKKKKMKPFVIYKNPEKPPIKETSLSLFTPRPLSTKTYIFK